MTQRTFLASSHRTLSIGAEQQPEEEGLPAPKYRPPPPAGPLFPLYELPQLPPKHKEPPPPAYVPPPPPNVGPLERYGVPPRIVSLASKKDCKGCKRQFLGNSARHNCGACGNVFCGTCTTARAQFPQRYGYEGPQRICARCLPKLIQTLISENNEENEIELSEKEGESDSDVVAFL